MQRPWRWNYIFGVAARLDLSISLTSSVIFAKSPKLGTGTYATVSLGPIVISADKVIPLGLLVNELVTNAVKYAYVNRPGVIRVDACSILV